MAAHHTLDRLPRLPLIRAIVAGPLDHQVKGVVPPEQCVRTVLPDDGHDAEAFEEIAERTRRDPAADDRCHQLALQSATRTRPSR